MTDPYREYHVALSFAGEQRAYVQRVAKRLKDAGARVFYDDYEKASLWGKDLYAHLDWIYREASHLCLMFASREYADKVWTTHERSSAQARALTGSSEYVLPVRFDDTEIPGLRPTIGYFKAWELEPEELAQITIKKLQDMDIQLYPELPADPDLLFKELNIRGQKFKKAREEAERVIGDFQLALTRMTHDERTALFSVYLYGCDLGDGGTSHISLDRLSRITGLANGKLLQSLRAVRSLNVTSLVTKPDRFMLEQGELTDENDLDLAVRFWASSVPDARRPNAIIQAAVRVISSRRCAEHAMESLVGLDFSDLSSSGRPELAPAPPPEHENHDDHTHTVDQHHH